MCRVCARVEVFCLSLILPGCHNKMAINKRREKKTTENHDHSDYIIKIIIIIIILLCLPLTE